MPASWASKPSTGEDCDEIERLALRDAFGDVEQDDVAEFLQADEMGERAADLAGADQRNLVDAPCGGNLRMGAAKGPAAAPGHSPFRAAVQAMRQRLGRLAGDTAATLNIRHA